MTELWLIQCLFIAEKISIVCMYDFTYPLTSLRAFGCFQFGILDKVSINTQIQDVCVDISFQNIVFTNIRRNSYKS